MPARPVGRRQLRPVRGGCLPLGQAARALFLKQLAEKGEIDGVISLGGGGGTAIATENDDETSIMRRADALLYASKRGGRDRIGCEQAS